MDKSDWREYDKQYKRRLRAKLVLRKNVHIPVYSELDKSTLSTQSESESESESESKTDLKKNLSKKKDAKKDPKQSKSKNLPFHWPESFELTPERIAMCEQISETSSGWLDAQWEWDDFKDHATRTGRTQLDWEASWRSWCRKAVDLKIRGR